jgi:hypothetical protein
MTEEWMSRLPCRGSIVRAAFVVALFSSGPAVAQDGVDPGPTRHLEGLLNALVTGGTGVKYDIVNQAKAERRLQKVQANLACDTERGDAAAVDRDVYRINNLKHRIVVDEWLIRKNCLTDPGPYPHALRLDHITCAAIADAARPAQEPRVPQYTSGPMRMPPPAPTYPTDAPTPGSTSATQTITIVNAQPAGAGVSFSIDGIPHQVAGGSRLELPVLPDSNITYEGGGSIGPREYRISPGVYEFRSTAEGLALYKLPDKP